MENEDNMEFPSGETSNRNNSSENPDSFGKTVGIIFAAITVVNVIVWFFALSVGTFMLTLAAMISTASLLYVISSWRFEEAVGPDEIGIVLFFGRPVNVIGSGLPFAPRGFFSIERLPISFRQVEYPAEPEDVYKGELKEREKLPEDMKPPIRITFRDSLNSEEHARKVFGVRDFTVLDLHKIDLEAEFDGAADWTDLKLPELEGMETKKQADGSKYPTLDFCHEVPKDGLSGRVTAEVVFIVRWRVYEPKATQFLRKVGSVSEANRQIEDELVSVANRLLTRMSVAQALENIAWFNAHLYFAIIKRTLEWGIRVDTAYAKTFNLHHDLNDAIGEVAQAEFKGRAEKILIQRRGEGEANAIELLEKGRLSGKAAGLKKMTTQLNLTGQEVVSAEAVKDLAAGGNTIVVGTEGITSAAAAATALLKKKGGTTEKE